MAQIPENPAMQEEQPQNNPQQGQMIQIQGGIINRLIKRIFPDKIVTAQFKKQFSRAISIFILFVQSGQAKKKYAKTDIIEFLEKEGFGKVAQDLRRQRVCRDAQPSRKKVDNIEVVTSLK